MIIDNIIIIVEEWYLRFSSNIDKIIFQIEMS